VLDLVRSALRGAFPRRITVRRTVWIARPREHVYPLIASFRTGWITWSPFGTQRDPTVTFTYDGPESGSGAVQRWTSRRMGTGEMHITRGDPTSGISYTIALTAAGIAFSGDCAIDIVPSGDGCDVIWTTTMDVASSLGRRLFGRLIRVGMTQGFDEGLVALKRAAER
jgi:hypothetical protein